MKNPGGEDDPIVSLLADLRAAQTIVVFSGAGASVESGIATFRGRGSGWWTGSLGYLVLPWFGTPFGWKFAPRYTNWLTFNLYHHFFYKEIAAASPNAFHSFLGRLCAEGRDVFVVTQNVDNLHQRGGVPAASVCEVHGTVLRNICISCGTIIPEGRVCVCGGYARPAATLFFEMLPWLEVGKADKWFLEKKEALVIVAGLSGSVGTSDNYIYGYKNHKCKMYNINPGESKYEVVASVHISRPVAETFTEINEKW